MTLPRSLKVKLSKQEEPIVRAVRTRNGKFIEGWLASRWLPPEVRKALEDWASSQG